MSIFFRVMFEPLQRRMLLDLFFLLFTQVPPLIEIFVYLLYPVAFLLSSELPVATMLNPVFLVLMVQPVASNVVLLHIFKDSEM